MISRELIAAACFANGRDGGASDKAEEHHQLTLHRQVIIICLIVPLCHCAIVLPTTKFSIPDKVFIKTP